MHIKELKINHYKSVVDPLTISNFSNLHILVGPNNAGKTNILDALNLFFESEVNKERFQDEKADIEILINFQEKDYRLKYKEGVISGDTEKLSLMQKSFIRVKNKDSIYDLIPKELERVKKNYPKNYDNFSKTLKKYFKNVEIDEKIFILNVHSDKDERHIKRMGAGFKRLFVMLFYLFHPEYGLILIDEPELHLHPSIIRNFLFILSEKKMNNQVFLTTHHPTFIEADYLRNIWRVARNKNNSTFVCNISESKINTNRFVQEINDDNSGMFFCDKILLVEGVSDYIFMREILKKFYNKDKDIKVVYTGGKGTVDLYSDLCDEFKIPYAIMLDRDALKSHSLFRVKKYPSFDINTSDEEKIKILKEQEIFILNGFLENVYLPKFKRKQTKPLTALYISRKMIIDDLSNNKMNIIKEIIEKI
jgi:predicted ATP-dependent endonuclease of OLD family